jgi:hypothetical protein
LGGAVATGLSDSFGYLLLPTEAETAAAVASSMVVVDTNVLLDAYRFAAPARAELLDALEKLGDRLWIPHQVALEFHRNRLKVIMEHDAAYRDAISVIEGAQRKSLDEIAKLGSRTALAEEDITKLKAAVIGGLGVATKQMDELRASHGVTNSLNNDDILHRLQRLFNGKVGEALESAEEQEARKEAKRRVDANEPPGYKDRDKSDPCGDYLAWYQTLKEAKTREKPVLIVTRDSRDDDWFWHMNGRTLGPRWELSAECQKVAKSRLFMLSTQSFLFHARASLRATVSESTLQQAGSLPEQPEGPATPILSDSVAFASTPSGMMHTSMMCAALAEELQLQLTALKRRKRPLFPTDGDGHLIPPSIEQIDESLEIDKRIRMCRSEIDVLRDSADKMRELALGAQPDRPAKFSQTMLRAIRLLDDYMPVHLRQTDQ